LLFFSTYSFSLVALSFAGANEKLAAEQQRQTSDKKNKSSSEEDNYENYNIGDGDNNWRSASVGVSMSTLSTSCSKTASRR
jgi:hypothetical protein